MDNRPIFKNFAGNFKDVLKIYTDIVKKKLATSAIFFSDFCLILVKHGCNGSLFYFEQFSQIKILLNT